MECSGKFRFRFFLTTNLRNVVRTHRQIRQTQNFETKIRSFGELLIHSNQSKRDFHNRNIVLMIIVVKALLRFQVPISHRCLIYPTWQILFLSHLSPPHSLSLFRTFLLCRVDSRLSILLPPSRGLFFHSSLSSLFTYLGLCRSPSLTEYTLRFPWRNTCALFFLSKTYFFRRLF